MKTDEEINALVHEKVAGKVYYRTEGIMLPDSLCAPDYVNDLNACHRLEIKLFGDEQKLFRLALIDICQTPEDAISATPLQRSIALLKAKWVEV